MKRMRCSKGGKCCYGLRKKEVIVTIGNRKRSIGKKWICSKCGLWL
jgi:hypothetical protein